MAKGVIFLIVLTAVVTACCAFYIKSLENTAHLGAVFVERRDIYGYVKQGI